MNASSELKLRKTDFLRWVQLQDGRFELKEGAVIMQAGTTRGHAIVCSRFHCEILGQLHRHAWEACSADLAVGNLSWHRQAIIIKT